MTGCNQQSDMNTLYETVFDSLLKNDDHIDDMDYISLFVQRDDVIQDDFSSIEKQIQETYQKNTYSYTTEELQDSGSYGKENLNEEGIYLYITEIEEMDDQTIVHSETYYTVESIKPFGMEMAFEKNNDEWGLIESTVEWKDKP